MIHIWRHFKDRKDNPKLTNRPIGGFGGVCGYSRSSAISPFDTVHRLTYWIQHSTRINFVSDATVNEAYKVSGQSNLTTGRIAAAHGQFSSIGQVAPMCTPPKTRFLGSTGVPIPNGFSIGSAVFAQLTTERPYTIGRPPPQSCPFPWRDLDLI